KAVETLRQNIDRMGMGDRCKAFRRDAFRLSDWAEPPTGGGYTLVFVDPPYVMSRGERGARQMPQLMQRLVLRSLLAPDAWIVLRHEAREDHRAMGEAYVVEDERRYGQMALTMFRYAGAGNSRVAVDVEPVEGNQE
ncbi:MAG: RsmD family RNA methyltransferase, partial [Phycisphaerae bacterium]|nr:RsmD family RNA methyltransferase [Phycisphaerae bacterium]